jgi:hypothetical protein
MSGQNASKKSVRPAIQDTNLHSVVRVFTFLGTNDLRHWNFYYADASGGKAWLKFVMRIGERSINLTREIVVGAGSGRALVSRFLL